MRNKRIQNIIQISIALLIITYSSAFGAKEILQGKIMRVKDGDTVVVSPVDGGQFFSCRLYGIDTPETAKKGKAGQPYGEEASRELKKLVLGQDVEVTTTGQKTYKREVCIIKRDGADINLEMVRRGYAWAYRQYLKRPYASDYIDAEKLARDKKLGLWRIITPHRPGSSGKCKDINDKV